MRQACIDGFPLEACGLFLGPLSESGQPSGEIRKVWPAHNSENSARVYAVDPRDMLAATNFAQQNDMDIVGVYHSHTHTEAYPSPTDREASIDPSWCYAIVSVAEEEPDIRYFSLHKDEVTELDCTVVS
jgi:proteasome lid subunit RPN8/RPN11